MPINEKDERRLYGYDAKVRSRKTFTKVEIRQALKDAAGSRKTPLSREEYQKYYDNHEGIPHPYTIIRRYEGKWSDALRDAGLKAVTRAPYKVRISEQDCLNALLEARKHLGHLPSTGEYQNLWKHGIPGTSVGPMKEDGAPSASTIRAKFDKWRTAVTEASKNIV